MERQLKAHGFRVLETERLPILYSEASIRRQLNVAKSKLRYFKVGTPTRAAGGGGLRPSQRGCQSGHCRDAVVTADHPL